MIGSARRTLSGPTAVITIGTLERRAIGAAGMRQTAQFSQGKTKRSSYWSIARSFRPCQGYAKGADAKGSGIFGGGWVFHFEKAVSAFVFNKERHHEAQAIETQKRFRRSARQQAIASGRNGLTAGPVRRRPR